MSGIVVVGAQWGDEGKGKIVDLFSSHVDMVVRYHGGANAGHTLVVNGEKTVLHLIPSGILHPETTCVIAPGVVVDIEGLIQEIIKIKAAGFLKDDRQLLISDAASVILPFHKKLDKARESHRTGVKIGTTGKGIGPAYEDRASRRALTIADLYGPPELLEAKLQLALSEKNILFETLYGLAPEPLKELYDQVRVWSKELEPYRCTDVSALVQRAFKSKKKVLFEGAQGTMLDIFHGTYPYVTSSSTVSGSACVGTGVGPTSISMVIGIFKAYTTRVGEGPFPTELKDEWGERIRQVGYEFGATTGRPRRTGWLDLVALKHSIRINGITNLSLMKMDVLTGMDRVGVCRAYKLDGEIIHEFPSYLGDLQRVEPVIEYLPGWKEDLTRVSILKDLPRAATAYIDFIGNEIGAPIDVISVGPGREQTLWVKPLFST